MNNQPKVAQKEPCKAALKADKTYYWCACGLSAQQPFCDGSHKTTQFTPLQWKAKKDGEVWLCACKKTKRPPFCDGSHKQLD